MNPIVTQHRNHTPIIAIHSSLVKGSIMPHPLVSRNSVFTTTLISEFTQSTVRNKKSYFGSLGECKLPVRDALVSKSETPPPFQLSAKSHGPPYTQLRAKAPQVDWPIWKGIVLAGIHSYVKPRCSESHFTIAGIMPSTCGTSCVIHG